MRLPIQVAIYTVRPKNEDWEFLLLHRHWQGGNFWQPVTGGVESGETVTAAALRELREETGFRPADLNRVDFTYYFPVPETMLSLYETKVTVVKEICFLATLDMPSNPVIDPAEHDGWQWVDYDTAYSMLHWSGNKAALKFCYRILNVKKTPDNLAP
jgi:8-oxo-dGTP pyrophosphatase MutT (NUDIX family)